jgi:hypothetical protein
MQIRALGLIALAALGFVGTLAEVGPVESDLTGRAAATLGGAGLESPALLVAGRDAAISGAASSPSARRGAVEAVAGVWGVRTVDAELVWIKPGASDEQAASAPRAAPGVDLLSYDFYILWPWLLPAAILGAAVEWTKASDAATSGRRRLGLALSGGAAAIAFAVGIGAAAMRWPPGRPGFWLEAGLLFLASYRVGGFAGESISRLRAPGERFVR